MTSVRAATAAWLISAAYYCYQYALRSAPGVMLPQLSEAFAISTAAAAAIAGLFYAGYSPFSLVAGTAIDGLGLRAVVPASAAALGIGALLFATGNREAASIGRLLQGAGGAFSLIGAAWVATTYFPPSRAATLLGATQMFGMAGGSAGQFLVAPLIASGVPWSTFWIGMGIAGLAMSGLLVALLPASTPTPSGHRIASAGAALLVVFRNPQSYLCGAIAGLLFIPTTIFDMVWGVGFLQEAHGMNYASAVLRSAAVPVGWMIGCPLLGFVSDRLGRRKPVMAAAAAVLLLTLAWILFGPPDALPPYVLAIVAGTASGAAMLPYTVIKEANPRHVSGTATGTVNFLNMGVTAVLGPIFASRLSASGGETSALFRYQQAFEPLLYAVGLAIVLIVLLRETGPAAQRLNGDRAGTL